jgi:hypothetical protein
LIGTAKQEEKTWLSRLAKREEKETTSKTRKVTKTKLR